MLWENIDGLELFWRVETTKWGSLVSKARLIESDDRTTESRRDFPIYGNRIVRVYCLELPGLNFAFLVRQDWVDVSIL